MNSLSRELLDTMMAISGGFKKDSKRNDNKISPYVIVRTVCKVLQVPVQDVLSNSRKRKLVEARQIAMFLVRYRSGLTLDAVGEYFRRDHSTVIYSLEVVSGLLDVDKAFRKSFKAITADLSENGKENDL